MNQLTLEVAVAAGQDAATQALDAAQRADSTFAPRASAFIVAYLAKHGPTSGEDLTEACKAAGIKPAKDGRAFGGIFLSLSHEKNQRIRCLRSDLPRRFGHGCTGGKLWAAVQ